MMCWVGLGHVRIANSSMAREGGGYTLIFRNTVHGHFVKAPISQLGQFRPLECFFQGMGDGTMTPWSILVRASKLDRMFVTHG